MLTIHDIKRTIIKGLYDEFGVKAIDADMLLNRRPNYPFVTIKVLSFDVTGEAGNYKAEFLDSLSDKFKYDLSESLEFEPTVTLSVQAVGNDEFEVRDIADKLYSYFKFVGKPALDGINAVVVDAGGIQNRSVALMGDKVIEYVYGLDVRLRYLNTIERRSPDIESWNIGGKMGKNYFNIKGDIRDGK